MRQPHPPKALRLPLLLILWLLCTGMVWASETAIPWQPNIALESIDAQPPCSEDGNGISDPLLTPGLFPRVQVTTLLPSFQGASQLRRPGHGGPSARAPPPPLAF